MSYLTLLIVWLCLSIIIAGLIFLAIKKKDTTLTPILIILTLIWTTSVGCLLLPALYLLRENSWSKFYPLPEKAVTIAADPDREDRIYFRSEGGDTYDCIPTFFIPGEGQRFTCNQLPPEFNLESLPPDNCSFFKGTPLPTPEGAIASDEYCAQYLRGWFFRKYVVLQDGSVWYWETGEDMPGYYPIPFTLALIAIPGAMVGLVLGVVLLIAIKVYRHVKSRGSQETARIV